MKRLIMFFLLSMMVILAACSNENDENSTEQDISETNDSSDVKPEESEDIIADEGEEETEEENEEGASDGKTDATASGENLLSEDFVLEYDEGNVVMTVDLAEFTREITTSTGEETREENVDNQIFLHLQGTINNDTVDFFEYGHPLAPVQFKFIYDGKHEFDTYAATESLDGSKFEGANIEPLQEQMIHIYATVPLPVSEGDKSLVLIITDSDGEHEVVLR